MSLIRRKDKKRIEAEDHSNIVVILGMESVNLICTGNVPNLYLHLS
jgi:hypothetical protein